VTDFVQPFDTLCEIILDSAFSLVAGFGSFIITYIGLFKILKETLILIADTVPLLDLVFPSQLHLIDVHSQRKHIRAEEDITFTTLGSPSTGKSWKIIQRLYRVFKGAQG
jgi:hypothetical protein